jgi:hypothetical protein
MRFHKSRKIINIFCILILVTKLDLRPYIKGLSVLPKTTISPSVSEWSHKGHMYICSNGITQMHKKLGIYLD